MAYVITQNCCKDESCVPACPVDCIRPVHGPGRSSQTEMLFIDPEACIDCGACMEECPVDAVYYDDDLPPELERFRDLNAAYFKRHPLQPDATAPPIAHTPVTSGSLRVAVVGAGPSACYAAGELTSIDGVEVNLFERLPTPFGLIRSGVAPDHQHTKGITALFTSMFRNPRFGCYLNVEIGTHATHADLLAHHHAVIYAVGASASRDLDIPGTNLPGSHAASEFVGWYNGHPDHAGQRFDLSGERAVIVGNGNVALDVARIILAGPTALATTDIAEHALEALASSSIREVVVLGRRGLRESAFSVGEFAALGHLDGVDVILEGADLEGNEDDDVETTWKLDIAREYAAREPTEGHRRIVFRFHTTPTAVLGRARAEGLRTARTAVGDAATSESNPPASDDIRAALILRSIGYVGSEVTGLPYDARSGTVPNAGGRVLDDAGDPMAGVYVVGWIKRGARGVVGTNRACSQETVTNLLADFDAGILDREVEDSTSLQAQLAKGGAVTVDYSGWQSIDAAERERGKQASRPRVKFVAVDDMLAAVRS